LLLFGGFFVRCHLFVTRTYLMSLNLLAHGVRLMVCKSENSRPIIFAATSLSLLLAFSLLFLKFPSCHVYFCCAFDQSVGVFSAQDVGQEEEAMSKGKLAVSR
jgi:hypothetical protein